MKATRMTQWAPTYMSVPLFAAHSDVYHLLLILSSLLIVLQGNQRGNAVTDKNLKTLQGFLNKGTFI